MITEIGGTVGEYQNILFLEAIRIMKLKKKGDVLLILVSYLPIQNDDSEPKTKPTQYAVRTLNSAGLEPDIILARSKVSIDRKRKQKIAFNCSLVEADIISAPDVSNLYQIPINFEKEKLGNVISEKLALRSRKANLRDFKNLDRKIRHPKGTVKIGIVGKYFGSGKFILADSYISVIEAVRHAAALWNVSPSITWLEAKTYEKGKREDLKELDAYDGIIVPGGFGSRGVEGKIQAIKYCRERKIPFLGLCYGMQLAVVEFARDVLGLMGANTTEVNPNTKYPVIYIMPDQKAKLAEKNYGATMRLGAYPAILKKGTIAQSAYGKNSISERHRHRYEVNPDYVSKFEKKGLVFSGVSPDRRLMEIVELSVSQHPFFVGTQFHPEFKSRPLNPHPLFREFMKAAIKKQIKKK